MTTVDSLTELSNASCELSLPLTFDGYHVLVKTNSEALLKELGEYYQHFIGDDGTDKSKDPLCTVYALQCPTPALAGDWQEKTPEPGKKRVKEQLQIVDGGVLVKKIKTGVHLFFLGEDRYCCGPLEANPNQVVNFINNQHLDHILAPSGELFHASGACINGIGLGMAGQSGRGKSTLALRLLQQGFDLVSNDRLVVQSEPSGLQMHGIAKYPRVNPGTVIHQPELLSIVTPENLARYQAMSRDELWELEEKYDAFIEPAFNVAFKLSAAMKMFVILNWDRHDNSGPELTKVKPGDHPHLVEHVMKSPGVMVPNAGARIGDANLDHYIELLNQCDLYILSGGVDFDVAAGMIKKILEQQYL